MKKFYFSNLFSYYLGLFLLPILLVFIFIFFSRQIITHSYLTPLSVNDFISKAQSLNLNIQYLDNNKQIKAENSELKIKIIQYENSQMAESDFESRYNQDKKSVETINKNAVKNSYDGKNYNTRYVYHLGNFAYIRVDNTYIEISSKNSETFENALNTFGYKNLMPKSTYILFETLIYGIIYIIFAYLAIPYAYIFKKANINPVIAYVPILYKYFLCKLADEKGWKMIFLYIPVVSIIYRLILSLKLSKVFNKSELFGIGVFFLPIFVNPVLAFDNSEYYLNDNSTNSQNKTIKVVPVIIFLICALALGVFITGKTKQQINKINQKINIMEKEGANFAAYMQDVEKKIKQNWNPPKENSSKYVTVKFIIGKNGELIDVTITKSSDVKSVDEAALEAVRASAPFKSLPKNYKGESIPIEFTFDYNVIKVVKK